MAAARHPVESRWSVFAGVYQALLGAVVVLAYAGGLLHGIREELLVTPGSVLTRPVVSDRFAQVPTQTALAIVLLMAAAGGFALLLRLGPVSATAAQGYWWLRLPIDRRRALALPATGKMVKTAAAVGLVFAPIAALAGPVHGMGSVLLGSATAAAMGTAVFLAAALVQVAGCKNAAARVAGVVIIAGLLVLLLPLLTADSLRDEILGGIPTQVLLLLPSGWPLVVVHGAMWPVWVAVGAVLAGVCAMSILLNRLSNSELTASGGISGHTAGAFYFGDFREMRHALKSDATSRRFRLSGQRPASAFAVLVRADLVAFLRAPGKVRNVLLLALAPAAVGCITGVGSAVVMAAVLLLCGWTAASTSAVVARAHADKPVLDGVLPLTPVQTRRAHAVVPVVCLTVWGLISFGLLAVMGPGNFELPMLGLLAGLGLAGAAIRGAFQPSPDWTTLGGSSRYMLMPAGVETSFTRGPDFAVLAMLPALATLISGTTPWWLYLVQAGSSAFCLWWETRAD